MRLLWFLLLILVESNAQYSVSGNIYDLKDSAKLAGVVVNFTNLSKFTVSNDNGFFSKKLKGIPKKTIVKSIGYEVYELDLSEIVSDTLVDIYLKANNTELSELIISSNNLNENLKNSITGVTKISINTIKKLPSLGGEKDIMKALMLLPGVKNISDGGAGMYVRGGSPDQNLVLFNNSPIYTSNQFFGLLSTFNSDAIQSIELYKGGIPARFGGRISSVLNVQAKKSKMDRIDVNGSLGFITAKLQIDIPIIKNKAGILFSTRRNYFDILQKKIPTYQFKTKIPIYHFADYTIDFTYKVNTKIEFKAYSYLNEDVWDGTKDNTMTGGQKITYKQILKNNIIGITLNYSPNPKFQYFLNTHTSRYKYDVTNGVENNLNYENNYFNTGIFDNSITNHANWFISNNLIIGLGVQFSNQMIIPHILNFRNSKQEITILRNQKNNRALTFYNDYECQITPKLKILSGIRITNLKNDTSTFFIEPRLSLNFLINKTQAIKFGFQNINQWLHLISNPGLGPIEDIWISSNKRILPQKGNQTSLSYERIITTNRNKYSFKSDFYFKYFKNIIAYKDGHSSSDFTIYSNNVKQEWESFIAQGNGKSYGLEALFEKKEGVLNGWVGYSISWTKHKFDELNNNKWFYARFDRRHDISVVLMYNLNSKWAISANWIYNTGQATTLPIQVINSPKLKINSEKYDNFGGNAIYVNSERNAYRMKDIHRLDFNFQRNVKHRWGEGTWDLSIYNVYNRRNPLYYYMGYNPTKNSYSIYSVSVFPIIGSISYNFRPFFF